MRKYILLVFMVTLFESCWAGELTLAYDETIKSFWDVAYKQDKEYRPDKNMKVIIFISKSKTKEGTYMAFEKNNNFTFDYASSEMIEGAKGRLTRNISVERKPYKGREAVYLSGIGNDNNKEIRFNYIVTHDKDNYYTVALNSYDLSAALDKETNSFLNGLIFK